MFAVRSQRHEELAEKNEALGNLREENARLRDAADRARAIADSQAARANAAEDECVRAIESLASTIADEQARKSELLAAIEAANLEAAQHAAKHEALKSVLTQIGDLAGAPEEKLTSSVPGPAAISETARADGAPALPAADLAELAQ